MATDRRNQNVVQLISFAIDVEANAPRKWMKVPIKKGQIKTLGGGRIDLIYLRTTGWMRLGCTESDVSGAPWL